MAGPRAHALIDLGALEANVRFLAGATAPAALMVVVKADAYGHGATAVAAAARRSGASWLGVAFTDEALALRQAGDVGRLLAWLLVPGDRVAECLAADVDLSANAPWAVAEIADAARAAGAVARVHLAIDSGLGREGANEEGLIALLEAAVTAERAGSIRVVGMWTHLANADAPGDPSIDEQHAQFLTAVGRARSMGLVPEVLHVANSAAALTRPDLHHDLVRVGIAAYGVTPGEALGDELHLGLRPVMTMVATLALVKPVRAGQSVSYGSTWTAPHDTVLGLVPVGYGDGVPRQASGRGLEVLVRGRRVPVVGRVCMDQVMVDLGPQCHVRVGDEVVLIGTSVGPAGGGTEPADLGADEITVGEIAELMGTIAYEVTCLIAPRVTRLYDKY